MVSFLLPLVLLFTSDLVNPPGEPASTESTLQLSMPGDAPIEWIEPFPGGETAFVMTGTLVAISSETVTIRRRGEIDAEFGLDPEAILTLDGESVTFDELPIGSKASVTFDLQGVDRVALEVRASP